MNWIRNNKFLAGFLGAVIAGGVALGVLLFLAIGHYNEVNEAYTAQVTELQRLRSLVPFPDQANLEKFKAQGKVLGDAIIDLQATLSTVQFPLEPCTPQQFQDKLRASINALTEHAAGNHVALPKDKAFALGFDRYQTLLPSQDASAPLARQLTAIDLVLNMMVSEKIDTITSLSRADLPEEKSGKPDKGLVVRHPFTVSFVAERLHFRKLMNDIVTSKKQFYIIRAIRVKNEAQKAPSKTAIGAPAEPAKTAAGKAKALSYLFGAEKLMVDMDIDIVNFDNTQKK